MLIMRCSYTRIRLQRLALRGSYTLDYPKEVYGTAIPAVTNTTACKNGFFVGWKYWCINHAVHCVENMTMGDFPEMMLKAYEQHQLEIMIRY